jgi:hypothetical protein
MSRYMMLITHSENLRTEDVPASLHEEMGQFVEKNLKNGLLISTAGLRPTSEGTRVRQSRRKLSITDGPFTEAKEVVGGYAVVEASSREQAVEVAREFMEIHLRHWPDFEGSCDVRPLDGDELTAPPSSAASNAASA